MYKNVEPGDGHSNKIEIIPSDNISNKIPSKEDKMKKDNRTLADSIITTINTIFDNTINVNYNAKRLYQYNEFIKAFIPDDIATCSNIRMLDVLTKCLTIQAKKQKDYSDAVFKGIDTLGPSYIIAQLYNKFTRLANLTTNNKNPNNESINDTYIDLACYSLLGLAYNIKDYKLCDNEYPSGMFERIIHSNGSDIIPNDMLIEISNVLMDYNKPYSSATIVNSLLTRINELLENYFDNITYSNNNVRIIVKLKEIIDILNEK